MLTRKLFRDLWSWRAQIFAVALIAAGGISVYVAMQSTFDSLAATKSHYYRTYRFADIFASLTRAPLRVATALRRIDGVASVQPRVVEDVTIDLAGREDSITARLVSVPDDRRPSLNDVYIRKGRYIRAGASSEALVSEAFAEANKLDVGDRVSAIVNRRHQNFRIVGIALSPEYLYEIRGGTDLWADNRHFGIMWVSQKTLAAAFDMTGAFNDVSIGIAPGANAGAIISHVDKMLARYGALGATEAELQTSNRFVSDELLQLRVQSLVIPAIFLGVAAFLLNISLVRFISLQRLQIAILKALGFSTLTVSLHYLAIVAVVMCIGTVGGIALGAWLGWRMTVIYTHFFRFPLLTYELFASVPLRAFAITGGAALAGALAGVLQVVRLRPAEAMRPPAPAIYRPALAERLGLTRVLSTTARMLLRNIERKPGTSAITMLSVSFAASMLVLGRFGYDAVGYMMDVQFRTAQREDMDLIFSRPLSNRARYELRTLPGVREVEPFRAVDARFSVGPVSRRTAILGLPMDTSLVRIVDKDAQIHRVPQAGVLISRRLAEILRVGTGDWIDVTVLEGRREQRTVRISGIVDDLIGLNAYMNENALHALLHEDRSISGAYLTTDPLQIAALERRIKGLPAVASVAYREGMLRHFEDTVAESMGTSIAFLMGFATIIAGGVVYNAGRVAIAERGAELSTLRVLGFTRTEIASILFGELALLVAVAIPLGWAIGYGLCRAFEVLYDNESYRIPVIVSPQTYAFSAAVVLSAAALSSMFLKHELDRLDLLAVLKETA